MFKKIVAVVTIIVFIVFCFISYNAYEEYKYTKNVEDAETVIGAIIIGAGIVFLGEAYKDFEESFEYHEPEVAGPTGEWETCPKCSGLGKNWVIHGDGTASWEECNICEGEGIIKKDFW